MRISVVIPAHNEEAWLGDGLAAVAASAERWSGEVSSRGSGVDDVEVIVVANRCTDETVAIARAAGATVVEDESRNIAAVRNAGAAAATGDVLVTIDADCRMPPTALADVASLLAGGRYVGGGTKIVPERRSLGISATYAVVDALLAVSRLSGGMFWCRRTDFEAVGGFDEHVLIAEDVDFARRLRRHGRKTGRRFTMLRTSPVVASTRKFDRYGDWHMFAMAGELRSIWAVARGTDTAWVDRYFFDFNDGPNDQP